MWGFVVYAATATVTACDLLYLLLWSTLGGPAHVLEYFALLAAILLFVAAHVSLWKRQVAAQLALTAVLVEWAFYLPAVKTTLAGNTPIALYGRAGAFAGLALLLLAIATAYSSVIAFHRPGGTAQASPSKGTNVFAHGGTVILLAAAGWGAFLVGSKSVEQSFDIVLPAAYRGWVRIDFAAPGAPALAKRAHELVVQVPSSGIVKTSTELHGNLINNRYRYENESAPVKVAAAFLLQRTAAGGARRKSEYLFVGDKMLQPNEQNSQIPVPGPIGSVPSGHPR